MLSSAMGSRGSEEAFASILSIFRDLFINVVVDVAKLRLRQGLLQIFRRVFDEAYGFFDEQQGFADEISLGRILYHFNVVHGFRGNEDRVLDILGTAHYILVYMLE